MDAAGAVVPALVTGLQLLDHHVHAPRSVALTLQVQAAEPYQIVVSLRAHPDVLPLLQPPLLLAVRPGPAGGHTIDWGTFDTMVAPPTGTTPTGLGAVTGGIRVTGVIPGWHVAAAGLPAWAQVTALTFTGGTIGSLAPALARTSPITPSAPDPTHAADVGAGGDLVAVLELGVMDGGRRFGARRVVAIPAVHLEQVEVGKIVPAAYLPAMPERSATLRWDVLGRRAARVPAEVRAALARSPAPPRRWRRPRWAPGPDPSAGASSPSEAALDPGPPP